MPNKDEFSEIFCCASTALIEFLDERPKEAGIDVRLLLFRVLSTFWGVGASKAEQ